MNYYYLDAGNQPVGPLTLDDIRRQAGTGRVPANPMVAREGAQQWHPLSSSAPADAPRALEIDHVLANGVASTLAGVRSVLSASFVEGAVALARSAGNYLVLAAGVLGLATTIMVAVKDGGFRPILNGVTALVVLACAHFASRLAFEGNARLIATAPARTSATAVLDWIALLALLGIVAALSGAITAWIMRGIWQPTIVALITAFYWACFTAIFLHPDVVKLEPGHGGVGEDFVGLLAFLFKVMLKLVALPFFVLCALGCISLVLGFFDLHQHVPTQSTLRILPLPTTLLRSSASFGGVGVVILACLLPVLVHVLFLLVSLPLDLWRALLAVPAKLDALKR